MRGSGCSSIRPTTASSRRWRATRSWRRPTRSCRSQRSVLPRSALPVPEGDANVQVIVDNLKSGLGTLFGTQVLRSLFLVGALMFFSFGLWNVLLLPMSLRELHATEFQYGLQEGLTSVGFVFGSF